MFTELFLKAKDVHSDVIVLKFPCLCCLSWCLSQFLLYLYTRALVLSADAVQSDGLLFRWSIVSLSSVFTLTECNQMYSAPDELLLL